MLSFSRGIVGASKLFYRRLPVCTIRKQFSTRPEARSTAISIIDGGTRLQAAWGSEGNQPSPSNYHAIWLRHNCQCPNCLSEYKQLLIEAHDLDPRVKISSANIADDERVNIKWSCGHEGHLSLDWIKKHSYSQQSLDIYQKRNLPKLPVPTILQKIEAKELNEDKGVLKWLKTLNEYGLCLLTGGPLTVEGSLEITRKVSPHLQETFYGGLNEVKVVENPINMSYGPGHLPPHMDITQYESHPGIILLHCIKNDSCVEGGESVVVDLLGVMEKVRATEPHHFNTLVRVPGTFNRIHYERDYPVHMVYRTPHIHLNKHGDIVKMRWCSFNHGPPLVPEDDIIPYYEALECVAKSIRDDTQFKVQCRLEPGDIMTVNNHRMLHGRTAITLNGGERHINNINLNIDEFKSTLQVLCAKYDPDYQARNVLNHDYSFSGPSN